MYVALTYLAMSLGLDKYAVQIRFSEVLIILAFITPAAIPGLYVGCLLANILTGCAPLDIAMGPLATLIGALGAYILSRVGNKKVTRWLCTIPNILANTVIVPIVIYVCYTDMSENVLAVIPFYALTVALGEIISSGVLGTVVLIYGERQMRKIM
jgi:uncharacterized membrane protein